MGEPFRFVVLDAQELTSAARSFLRRYRINYISIRDSRAKTSGV